MRNKFSIRHSILRVVVFLIFLEGYFFIGAQISSVLRDWQINRSLNLKSDYRILCLGESLTASGGDQSYPNQLEKILNKKNPQKKFVVINKGMAGMNSSFIADQLGGWIAQYQPDMVVAMIGLNDGVNFVEFNQQASIKKWLGHIRIYQVVRQQWNDWSSRRRQIEKRKNELAFDPGEKNQTKIEPKMGADVFHQELKRAPKIYQQLYQFSSMAMGKGDYASAEKIYRKLIEMNAGPTLTASMYRKLASALRGQQKHEALFDEFSRIPFDEWGEEWTAGLCRDEHKINKVVMFMEDMSRQYPQKSSFYDMLAVCYQVFGDRQQEEFYLQKAKSLRSKGYNAVTQNSYKKITAILKNHDIQAVYVQYPLRSFKVFQRMLHAIEGVNDILLVDNDKVFQEALRVVSYDELFADRSAGNFGHGTAKGNLILAENIADVILKEIF